MVISLCARSYAKRIFPRNSNIIFNDKMGRFSRLGEKGKISQKRGNAKKRGRLCAL